MEKWVEAANSGEKTLEPVYIENEKGERKLLALTPPPARGKRQIQAEAELISAATAILKAHDVEEFLTYTFER